MTRPPLFAALAAVLALAGVAQAVDPHSIGGGLWECPRGYLVKQGPRCVPEQRGVAIEVSPLPSAGEGSRQPPSSYEYRPIYLPPQETTIHVDVKRHGCEDSGIMSRTCW